MHIWHDFRPSAEADLASPGTRHLQQRAYPIALFMGIGYAQPMRGIYLKDITYVESLRILSHFQQSDTNIETQHLKAVHSIHASGPSRLTRSRDSEVLLSVAVYAIITNHLCPINTKHHHHHQHAATNQTGSQQVRMGDHRHALGLRALLARQPIRPNA